MKEQLCGDKWYTNTHSLNQAFCVVIYVRESGKMLTDFICIYVILTKNTTRFNLYMANAYVHISYANPCLWQTKNHKKAERCRLRTVGARLEFMPRAKVSTGMQKKEARAKAATVLDSRAVQTAR